MIKRNPRKFDAAKIKARKIDVRKVCFVQSKSL